MLNIVGLRTIFCDSNSHCWYLQSSLKCLSSVLERFVNSDQREFLPSSLYLSKSIKQGFWASIPWWVKQSGIRFQSRPTIRGLFRYSYSYLYLPFVLQSPEKTAVRILKYWVSWSFSPREHDVIVQIYV